MECSWLNIRLGIICTLSILQWGAATPRSTALLCSCAPTWQLSPATPAPSCELWIPLVLHSARKPICFVWVGYYLRAVATKWQPWSDHWWIADTLRVFRWCWWDLLCSCSGGCRCWRVSADSDHGWVSLANPRWFWAIVWRWCCWVSFGWLIFCSFCPAVRIRPTGCFVLGWLLSIRVLAFATWIAVLLLLVCG